MTPTLLTLALVLAAQDEMTLPKTLDLFVGAQVTLDVKGVTKVAVADPSVVEVRTLGGGQLLVSATREGQTTVRIWRQGLAGPHDLKLHVGKTAAKATTEDELVTLKVGERRIFTPKGKVLRIAVGDSDIVDLEPLGDAQLLLKAGKKAADTTLIVWSEGLPRQSFLLHVVQ